jgi:hypothetical protein
LHAAIKAGDSCNRGDELSGDEDNDFDSAPDLLVAGDSKK